MRRKLTALLLLLALACACAQAEYRLENETCYLHVPEEYGSPQLCYFADITNTGDTWLNLNNNTLYALDANGQPLEQGFLIQAPETLLPGEHGYLIGTIYFFEDSGVDASAIRSYSLSLKHNPKYPPPAILYPSSTWYVVPEVMDGAVLCLENDTGEDLKNPDFLMVLRGSDGKILYAEHSTQLSVIIPPGSKSEERMFQYGSLPEALPGMGYSLEGSTLEYLVWGERDITTGG